MKTYKINGNLLAYTDNAAFIRSRSFGLTKQIQEAFEDMGDDWLTPERLEFLGELAEEDELNESTTAVDVYSAEFNFKGDEILITATVLQMEEQEPNSEILVLEVERPNYNLAVKIQKHPRQASPKASNREIDLEDVTLSMVSFAIEEVRDTVPRNVSIFEPEIEKAIRADVHKL